MSEDREYYDELEVRSPSARQAAEADELARQIALCQGERPRIIAKLLADVDPT